MITSVAPVIPVVTIADPATAVPIARALLAGGIGIIELTLRTPAALESLALIASQVPEMLLGAGTVLDERQVQEAVGAGAQFLVSPGCTQSLLAALQRSKVPFLPGASSVSEVLALLDAGVTTIKFFPATAAGGVPFIAALAAPLPQARFCPTGGITAETAGDFLALPNVDCIGGSWLTPGDAVTSGDWDRISALAEQSLALRR